MLLFKYKEGFYRKERNVDIVNKLENLSISILLRIGA